MQLIYIAPKKTILQPNIGITIRLDTHSRNDQEQWREENSNWEDMSSKKTMEINSRSPQVAED
jgi:hypothetical protein